LAVLLNKKERRLVALLLVIAIGVLFLSTAVMDFDWMAMQWHGNRDNGEMWTFIPNLFVVQWYWAYVFTVVRMVVGSVMITAAVCILAANDGLR
jgi:amino acid transporter